MTARKSLARRYHSDLAARFVPGYLALAAIALFSRGAPWRGEWGWTFDASLGTTVLTGPLLAAAATTVVATNRRRAGLTDPTPRGFLVPFRDASRAYGWALVAQLIALALGVGLTLTVRHGGPAPWWVLGMVPAILGAYAALGMAVGYHWPSLIVVPVVGIGSFVLGLLGALGVGPNLLRQGPVTGSLAGLRWDVAVFVGQLTTLAGCVAVVAFLTLPTAMRRYRVAPVVGGAGVLLLVSGLASLGNTGDERFEPSDEPVATCAGANPQVCVAASNQRSLDRLAVEVDVLARPLDAADVDVPARYDQLLPNLRPDPEHGMFALPSSANDLDVAAAVAAEVLTRPAPCAEWFGATPPPARVFQAESLLQWWLIQRSGAQPPAVDDQATTWLGEPMARQIAWVRTVFGQLQTCDLASVRLPWSP